MYYRFSSNVIHLRQILWELCPFWGLEYWKYTVFRTLFSYMLWHIALKFCIWLSFTVHVLHIKFECRQFASIFVGVMPLLDLRILEIHSILHFPLTCFGIIIELKFYRWLCFTVLQIKFECCQFASIVLGVMPLYWKYTVFGTFLLRALTSGAEVFHMTLFNVL